MPPPNSRRKICPRCDKLWTRQTVHRHLNLGCTRHEQEANRRKAIENQLSPRRELNSPLHHRNTPPPSPPPSPISPRRRKRGRGPGRHSDAYAGPPGADVRMRSPDFAFDTPGAGPSSRRPLSPGQPDDEVPIRLFEDEWDGHVPLDSDSDDGRPEEPTLADHAPWLEGLTASAILSQELEAELARTGGKCSHL